MMEDEERFYWDERRRYEEEMEYYEWYRRYGHDRPHPMGPPGPRMMFNGPNGPPLPMPPAPPMPPMMQPMRRPDTADSRYVMAKHSEIYPKENELAAVQRIVSDTEKALKMVSDYLAQIENSDKDAAPVEQAKDDSTATADKYVSCLEPMSNHFNPLPPEGKYRVFTLIGKTSISREVRVTFAHRYIISEDMNCAI